MYTYALRLSVYILPPNRTDPHVKEKVNSKIFQFRGQYVSCFCCYWQCRSMHMNYITFRLPCTNNANGKSVRSMTSNIVLHNNKCGASSDKIRNLIFMPIMSYFLEAVRDNTHETLNTLHLRRVRHVRTILIKGTRVSSLIAVLPLENCIGMHARAIGCLSWKKKKFKGRP